MSPHKSALELKKGDKIVSVGGIMGTIVSVKDGSVTVKIADNTTIEMTRSAVSSVTNKKEEKANSSDKGKK